MVQNVKDTIFVRYHLIGQIQNQVKFMNTSTEHILQCNQSEPLADAGGRIVDLMNENDSGVEWEQIPLKTAGVVDAGWNTHAHAGSPSAGRRWP